MIHGNSFQAWPFVSQLAPPLPEVTLPPCDAVSPSAKVAVMGALWRQLLSWRGSCTQEGSPTGGRLSAGGPCPCLDAPADGRVIPVPLALEGRLGGWRGCLCVQGSPDFHSDPWEGDFPAVGSSIGRGGPCGATCGPVPSTGNPGERRVKGAGVSQNLAELLWPPWMPAARPAAREAPLPAGWKGREASGRRRMEGLLFPGGARGRPVPARARRPAAPWPFGGSCALWWAG